MSAISLVLFSDDVAEAYNLIKDLEPTTPQEYILKGVVNAALGQEQGSVSLSLSVICQTNIALLSVNNCCWSKYFQNAEASFILS